MTGVFISNRSSKIKANACARNWVIQLNTPVNKRSVNFDVGEFWVEWVIVILSKLLRYAVELLQALQWA